MRALYYFQLLDFWGGVPLYDETTIISDDFMNMKSLVAVRKRLDNSFWTIWRKRLMYYL